ncbi:MULTISPECIES: metalloregulator ArsR/SmtB family transcription factor [Pedobacter]|uniref:ArsR family transcriptional regulator n=1 Tax=Pedobacter kyungheensis TaxID=1069985 RepID=A0A0C1G3M5_9SPHI|nr:MULTISPECIES: metalloregulator ArsR/SmtB family transcription factor [Pedobacter]KIA94739.1 ArsR family transcriptional regulator [Pedobacter kyungheensis]
MIKNTDNLSNCIREKANPMQINGCRNKIKENAYSFSQLSGILSLAGNEVRLKILYLLQQEKELCPCDLSDILGMSIPAVSQHLRKMKDGNIIGFRKDGQTIFYSLRNEHLRLMQPFFTMINQANALIETV